MQHSVDIQPGLTSEGICNTNTRGWSGEGLWACHIPRGSMGGPTCNAFLRG